MKKSTKKEIISGVGKVLNDFVKIKSLFENNILYENEPIPLIFNIINTDDIFTKVIDILDKNSVEINQLNFLFTSLNKDTYDLSTKSRAYTGVVFDLYTIIKFLKLKNELLK